VTTPTETLQALRRAVDQAEDVLRAAEAYREAAAAMAPIADLDGLRKAVARRRRDLGLTQLEANFRAGLADGHWSKIECGDKQFGFLSLPLVLETLDAVLVLQPKQPNQMEKSSV
jgi:hypothetical protein